MDTVSAPIAPPPAAPPPPTLWAELRAPVSRGAVRAVADRLRGWPGEVTPLVESALREAGVLPAAWLLLAALSAGRPAPAPITLRVLLQAPEDDNDLAAVVAWGCPERRALLLDLCRSEALMYSQSALYLFLAVEDLGGEAPPPALLARLRRWARVMERPDQLIGLALEGVTDRGARLVGVRHLPAGRTEKAQREAARLRRLLQGPPPEVAPERVEHCVSGFTVRRQPTIGRNDPCPCGSGTKYKRCCEARAQPRVSDLSPVPGLTLPEYRARIAEFVPVEKFDRMTPDELLPIPLERLPPAHLAAAARRFLCFDRAEAAERALSLLEAMPGQDAVLAELRKPMLLMAVGLRRVDILQRHVPLIVDPHSRRVGEFFIALLTDASPVIGLVEELAREHLALPREEGLDLLMHLFEATHPAVALLLGRAALDPRFQNEAKQIATSIERLRDELNLPPEDRFPFVLLGKAREGLDTMRQLLGEQRTIEQYGEALGELADLEKALEAARQRVAELEAELARDAQDRAELRRLAEAARAQEQRAQDEEREQEEDRRRLLGKIERLKALVAQGVQERAALRQRVAELEAQPAAQDLPAAQAPASPAEELEDGRWESDGYDGWRVVLTPVWTKAAHAALHELPPHISREALVTIGQLAAGEPVAWRGAKRLKDVTPPLYEARVGLRYRAMFRIIDENMEVLEIIHRKQLDLRLRQLYA